MILETLLHVFSRSKTQNGYIYTPERSRMISEMKILYNFVSKLCHLHKRIAVSVARCPVLLFKSIHKDLVTCFCRSQNAERAVNRQPSYHRGDSSSTSRKLINDSKFEYYDSKHKIDKMLTTLQQQINKMTILKLLILDRNDSSHILSNIKKTIKRHH